MGLDQYAFTRNKENCVAQWRKHARLQEFMERLWVEKTGTQAQNFGGEGGLNNEFMELQKKLNELNILKSIQNEIEELDKVNSQLWTIEDDIREKEKRNEFDESFINLARSVYKVNDKRAFFKKQINVKTGSLLIEEKSYSQY